MDSSAIDLAWRVDEACMNACPAPRQVMLRGWLARISGGPMRRTNSVNPQQGGDHDPRPLMAAFDRLYKANGQPTLYRVPSMAVGMAAALDAEGFAPQAETRTLFADMAEPPAPDAAVELLGRPSEAWFGLRFKMNVGEEDSFRRMTAAIALPRAFAAVRLEGEVVAIAYGVIDQGLLIIEAVATAPDARNRGLARSTVGTLMAWGRSQGADASALQVMAANAPAVTVYTALGFNRELYRYHYRRKET
jgi:ribosomal protein S18 acetylase RimI-like enzyme